MDISNYRNFGQAVSHQDKKATGDAKNFGQVVSDAAHQKKIDATDAAEEGSLNLEAPQDVQRDKAILEQHFSAASQPEKLTLAAVVDKLNLILEPDLGPNAIQTGVSEGLDVSPEATADRIVSLTTAMFSAFQRVHPELEGEELVGRFVDLISQGITQGFSEARDILTGMGALSDEIAANIDKTFELVMAGLERFKADQLNGDAPADSEGTSNETSTT